MESTIRIIPSSRLRSRTIIGKVSMCSSSQARLRRCPEISSYRSSAVLRAIIGVITPKVAILSTKDIISSSSRTWNGWSGESSIYLIGTTLTFSRFISFSCALSGNFCSAIFSSSVFHEQKKKTISSLNRKYGLIQLFVCS